MKDDFTGKLLYVVTRIRAGITGAHVFDGDFIPPEDVIDRDFPLDFADNSVPVIKNNWELFLRIEVPSDPRPCVRLTTELDRCPG